jgi:hypothetical protein
MVLNVTQTIIIRKEYPTESEEIFENSSPAPVIENKKV